MDLPIPVLTITERQLIEAVKHRDVCNDQASSLTVLNKAFTNSESFCVMTCELLLHYCSGHENFAYHDYAVLSLKDTEALLPLIESVTGQQVEASECVLIEPFNQQLCTHLGIDSVMDLNVSFYDDLYGAIEMVYGDTESPESCDYMQEGRVRHDRFNCALEGYSALCGYVIKLILSYAGMNKHYAGQDRLVLYIFANDSMLFVKPIWV